MNFEIVIATTNKHKTEEYRAILSKHKITVYSFADLNISLPDVEENGKTFIENAKIKAEAAAKKVKFPVIADDSGLILKAYKNFPGIHTARFAKQCGTQEHANQKIIDMLKGKSSDASFHCAIALYNVKKEPLIFTGECKGKIKNSFNGEKSFGYDPIFIPNGKNKSFHEIDKKEKNEISHRALACKKLITALKVFGLI